MREARLVSGCRNRGTPCRDNDSAVRVWTLALVTVVGISVGCGGGGSGVHTGVGGQGGSSGTAGGGTSGAGTSGGGTSGGTGGGAGATTIVGRKVDLLFMIDDSSSMLTAQANLSANIGAFMDVLKALPGGLPDLHVAVVTSDLGGGAGNINGCGSDAASPAGDGGIFKFAPTGTCTATGLDPGATFLVDSGGAAPQTNFGTQDITAVFRCITTVGDHGCGLEHQLASIARALGADGSPAPAQNAGFLRSDALLAIVLLTNEDDCSAAPGSPLFNPISQMLSSTYGPTENFLCNEWGHLCVPPGGGTPVRPSRLAPNGLATDMVTYSPATGPDNCVSSEGQGKLLPVGTGGFADQIKALKSKPASQILVAALTGPTTPYTVNWRMAPTTDTGPWPFIVHSCGDETSVAGFADPAVRIQQFVQAFGSNGIVQSFCQTDYSPSLTAIATKLGQLIGS